MAHWRPTAEQRARLGVMGRLLRERLGIRVSVDLNNCRRAALWLGEDGRCYWCDRLTVWYHKGGALPLDAATVDHLYPRGHPEHGRHPRSTVLACHDCNEVRGAEWQHHPDKPCLWPRCWVEGPHEHELRPPRAYRSDLAGSPA